MTAIALAKTKVVTGTGEQENQSVYRRLLDILGELALSVNRLQIKIGRAKPMIKTYGSH